MNHRCKAANLVTRDNRVTFTFLTFLFVVNVFLSMIQSSPFTANRSGVSIRRRPCKKLPYIQCDHRAKFRCCSHTVCANVGGSKKLGSLGVLGLPLGGAY